MKFSFKLMTLLAIAGMFVIGCEKNDSDDDSMDQYFEAAYSDKDTAEVKADLEQTGVEVQEAMNDLTDEEGIDVTANLIELLTKSTIFDDLTDFMPISEMAAMKNGQLPKDALLVGLKSTSEDPENLQEAWNMLVGEYVYNAANDAFDEAVNNDAIIIKFPGLEGNTDNNAQLKVDNFSVYQPTQAVPSTDVTIPELPSSLNAEITFNNITVLTYSFSASYQENGVPNEIKTELSLGAFAISYTFEHDPYSKANTKYSLVYNEDIIMEVYAESNGDWSEENIEGNTYTVEDGWWQYDYQYDETTQEYVVVDSFYYDDSYNDIYFENVVNNANSYVQVMDIKIAGAMNINELATAIRDLEEEYYSDNSSEDESDEEEYTEKFVEAFNKSGKLVVVYAGSNQKIASAEAYPKKYTYINHYCNYNEQTWEFTPCEESYWDMGVNMVFGDGSKVDAEVYFTELFDAMTQDLDDFFSFLDQF